jgi:hypoxanthine phosphoribosyltransferase
MTAQTLTLRVATLGHAAFKSACADLRTLVEREFRPDVVIGIRSGGYYVAEAMLTDAWSQAALVPLTCRRVTTGVKNRVPGLRQVVSRLPASVADRIRLLEHRYVTLRKKPDPQRRTIDAEEANFLSGVLSRLHPRPSVLVVDDAVDSGATLFVVTQHLRQAAHGAEIRSAALTVTSAAPLARPDYALFHHVLFRFPWSLDAADVTSSDL